jgi:chemotaxis protein CheD
MKVYDGSTTGGSTEMPTEKKKVGIAEYEVTTSGAVLTTSGLGSCIGVALYDGRAEVAGLVHVMLPTAADTDGNRAKFADTGVEVLVEAMEDRGADRRRITAKVAGGSDMLDFSENGSSIGSRNLDSVRETLATFSIPVEGEDVGGDHGRSLKLEAASGDLVVKSASQDSTTL